MSDVAHGPLVFNSRPLCRMSSHSERWISFFLMYLLIINYPCKRLTQITWFIIIYFFPLFTELSRTLKHVTNDPINKRVPVLLSTVCKKENFKTYDITPSVIEETCNLMMSMQYFNYHVHVLWLLCLLQLVPIFIFNLLGTEL